MPLGGLSGAGGVSRLERDGTADCSGCAPSLRERGTRVALIDGDARLIDGFLTRSESDAFLEQLLRLVAWEQQVIRIAGRSVASPRLSAWYGDPGARYCYSGLALEP
ncbi:MAG TPA: hypothetical protein VEC18_04700, partial [Myxococcota bacterium]|nr:hypothetical protein [Myxococcota bacterium]